MSARHDSRGEGRYLPELYTVRDRVRTYGLDFIPRTDCETRKMKMKMRMRRKSTFFFLFVNERRKNEKKKMKLLYKHGNDSGLNVSKSYRIKSQG